MKPCKTCPFLKHTWVNLRPDRLRDIHRTVVQNNTVFTCHQYLGYSEKKQLDPATSKPCIGSVLYVRHIHGSELANYSNRLMKECNNPRLQNPEEDPDFPVVKSLEEFLASNT